MWVIYELEFGDALRLPRRTTDAIGTSPIHVDWHLFPERWNKGTSDSKSIWRKCGINFDTVDANRVTDWKGQIFDSTDVSGANAVLGTGPKVFIHEICWTKEVDGAANIFVEGRPITEVANVIRRTS